jgi:hypothetical protein
MQPLTIVHATSIGAQRQPLPASRRTRESLEYLPTFPNVRVHAMRIGPRALMSVCQAMHDCKLDRDATWQERCHWDAAWLLENAPTSFQ